MLYKHRYYGFYETDLDEIVNSFSVQYLIFTGCTTSVCYLEFRLRVKTQGSLASEGAVLVLLYGLVASGQIRFRKLDGWLDMATALRLTTPSDREAA